MSHCVPERFEITAAADRTILITADLPIALAADAAILGLAIDAPRGAALIGLASPDVKVLLPGLSGSEVAALTGMTACRIVLCGTGPETPALQTDLPCLAGA